MVTVDVKLDNQIFSKFAVFDNLLRRRQWVTLAVFTLIMLVCASICFVMRAAAEHAVMLGGVLIAVGLVIPMVYLGMFFRSVGLLVKAHKLEKPRLVYSLQLLDEPDGVRVSNPGGESAQYKWDAMFGVYRVAGCTYLYAAQNRAFLLPDGQVDGGVDALWDLLEKMLPAQKLHDRRLKKT